MAVPSFMRDLFECLDVRGTIEVLKHHARYNRLAQVNKRYSWYESFRYDVNKDRVKAAGRDLMKLGFTGKWASGVSKICFFHRSAWVVKIPLIKAFAPLLHAELEMMRRAPEDFKTFFPTTYEFEHGKYVFQEKCRPSASKLKRCDRYDELMDFAERLGITDLHEDNIGFNRRGEPKIIDIQTETSLRSVENYRRGKPVSA